MRFAVGSDSVQHISEVVTRHLSEKGIEVVPCGALRGEKADYVDSGRAVAEKVAAGECEYGILLCNTGTGASIAANKVPGVRAALCVDAFSARISKLANNANVLVLSMRLCGDLLAREIIDEWLATAPSTEPHRVAFHRKVDELDSFYRSRPSDPSPGAR
ncbi:MAG TPA: RpiB/LacA/LacB family sugar-phosphate isomerase [Spirochaetia bacterium]|nr:RpiB/LacA/LacB family sugar-phosphate isomerase [Spirochaetia bacterium]HTZ50041.1 RpiB/LacA/LacB family sugar-phosphate isomerase [Spirochaetia bacterium]